MEREAIARLALQALLERHADALDRGEAVGQHRLLRKGRQALGQLERPLDVPPRRDKLRDEAHSERLVDRHHPPREDDVERAPEAHDPRQPLSAAVDQRHAPAPLGEAEYGTFGRYAQIAPERQLEPARQAPTGDGGDGGLRRDPAREAEWAARCRKARPKGVDRLQVRARAERDAARAGEDEHARVFVGLETLIPLGQEVGRGAVDGVAAIRAIDGEHRGRAEALVGHLILGHRGGRRVDYQPASWRFWAAFFSALRRSSAPWMALKTMTSSVKNTTRPRPKMLTTLSSVSP